MLVKSFTDNLAWEVQRTLINSYFRIKEVENGYSAKPTSVGEIATMIKTLRSVMKDQKSNPGYFGFAYLGDLPKYGR